MSPPGDPSPTTPSTTTSIALPRSPYLIFTAWGTTSPPKVVPSSGSPVVVSTGSFTLYVPVPTPLPPTLSIGTLLSALSAAASPPASTSFVANSNTSTISASGSGNILYIANLTATDYPLTGAGTNVYQVGSTSAVDMVKLDPAQTLYLPVTALSVSVEVDRLVDALKAQLTPPPLFSPFSVTGAPTTTPETTAPVPSNSKASGTSSSTSSNNGQASSTGLTPGKHGIPEGSVIGGSVGGFLLGCFICCLLAAFILRRRSQKTATTAHRVEQLDSHYRPTEKEAQLSINTVNIASWEKHLPQDKDDGTITKTFASLFEEVQIHVEAFYGPKHHGLTGKHIALLTQTQPALLSTRLQESNNAGPLLECILVRWIILRISLRSDVQQSFLPREFAEIPKLNNWHMERDGQEQEDEVEGRRGFMQAFSQWRRLTTFLHGDPRSSRGFQNDLALKIEESIQRLGQAIAPWEVPGRNEVDRVGNLRRLFHMASDAGILLFAQPSTFMFDWSNVDSKQSVVVAPALVKRLDEHGVELYPGPVLIKARRVHL